MQPNPASRANIYRAYGRSLVSARYEKLPPWLRESLADVLQAFTPGADTITLDANTRNMRFQVMRTLPLLPLDTLFATESNDPRLKERDNARQYFSQSWMLLYYAIFAQDNAPYTLENLLRFATATTLAPETTTGAAAPGNAGVPPADEGRPDPRHEHGQGPRRTLSAGETPALPVNRKLVSSASDSPPTVNSPAAPATARAFAKIFNTDYAPLEAAIAAVIRAGDIRARAITIPAQPIREKITRRPVSAEEIETALDALSARIAAAAPAPPKKPQQPQPTPKPSALRQLSTRSTHTD